MELFRHTQTKQLTLCDHFDFIQLQTSPCDQQISVARQIRLDQKIKSTEHTVAPLFVRKDVAG